MSFQYLQGREFHNLSGPVSAIHDPQCNFFFPHLFIFDSAGLTFLGCSFVLPCLFKAHMLGILLMAERLLHRSSSLPPQYSVPCSENTSQSIKIMLKIVPHFRRETATRMDVSKVEGRIVNTSKVFAKAKQEMKDISTDLPLPADGQHCASTHSRQLQL